MSANFGYGQLQPEDALDELNAIFFAARQLIAQIDTLKLVKVVAVHAGGGSPPAGGTVDVLPLVKQVDGNGFPVPHGTVYGLPFFRLQAGPWAIIADPVVGDVGYVICADRDSSNVVKNKDGNQTIPGSRRSYNIADGIYVGAIGILNSAPSAFLQLKSDGTFLLQDKNNNTIESSASDWKFGIGGTTVLTLTGSLATFSVNVQASDFKTSTLPSYVNHTHHVAAAPGESSPPTSGT